MRQGSPSKRGNKLVCKASNSGRVWGKVVVRVTLSWSCVTVYIIVGASLSEPHASVTALLDVYVCLWPYTENLN